MSKGAETRTRILDTAQELVLRQGFSGTSIDEILDAAGITKGGFFYHFRGKADLARAMMERYLAEDERFFEAIAERARDLVDDPLQQLLVFLKLYAEAMADMATVHPGCLIASFTYESQQFDPAICEMAAQGALRWRRMFAEALVPVIALYPPNEKVDANDLGDHFVAVLEGAILLSRMLRDQRILVEQVLHFRRFVQLLFSAARPVSA